MFSVSHLANSFQANLSVLVSAGQREQHTWDWYHFQFRKLIRVAGELPADGLRTHHLGGVKFTHHFVRALKALYRWGVEEDLVPKDPFKKLETPKCGQRTRTIKPAEMIRLYRESPQHFRLFLFVLRYTMARPGEIRRLRWGQVDLNRGVIRLSKFKGQKRRREYAKERVIGLHPRALKMFKRWHARRGPSPESFVFPAANGGERSPNSIRCMMRRVREKAGLDADGSDERLVLYHLRHTGATNAIRNGVNPVSLGQQLGHTKTDMTVRYVHFEDADLVDVAEQAMRKKKR